MSDRVRELNKKLDCYCAKLASEKRLRDELLQEQRTLQLERVRLALRIKALEKRSSEVDKQVKKVSVIVSCRERDIDRLLDELPLTQASPQSSPPDKVRNGTGAVMEDEDEDEDIVIAKKASKEDVTKDMSMDMSMEDMLMKDTDSLVEYLTQAQTATAGSSEDQ